MNLSATTRIPLSASVRSHGMRRTKSCLAASSLDYAGGAKHLEESSGCRVQRSCCCDQGRTEAFFVVPLAFEGSKLNHERPLWGAAALKGGRRKHSIHGPSFISINGADDNAILALKHWQIICIPSSVKSRAENSGRNRTIPARRASSCSYLCAIMVPQPRAAGCVQRCCLNSSCCAVDEQLVAAPRDAGVINGDPHAP